MNNALIYLSILAIPLIVLFIYHMVTEKYKKIDSSKKLSGFEIARKILDKNDLDRMYIVEAKGSLNDHYATNQKVIRLSTSAFHDESIMALVMAAYQTSYAILDKENDSFWKIKKLLKPIMDFASYISYILFVVGLLMAADDIIMMALAVLVICLVYQVAMLPLEFKIKDRTLKQLKENKLFIEKEQADILKYLNVITLNGIASMILNVANVVKSFIKERG